VLVQVYARFKGKLHCVRWLGVQYTQFCHADHVSCLAAVLDGHAGYHWDYVFDWTVLKHVHNQNLQRQVNPAAPRADNAEPQQQQQQQQRQGEDWQALVNGEPSSRRR
jgi:hypothetical protein